MANLLWGKVFYGDQFAGYLKEESGERYSFTYDRDYLDKSGPSVSYTLPLREKPHFSEQNLHPFFDNLVAEGWLADAQRRLIGKRNASRFELLLSFGLDCAGAVSVVDPDPVQLHVENIDEHDSKSVAIYRSRASLSGIQPKVMLIEEAGRLRPSSLDETSTHIAKLQSDKVNDITYNEWITLSAAKALFPEDDYVEAEIKEVEALEEEALVVKRFDRVGEKRLHFEEFNQLLNKFSSDKYEGAYSDMARFIYSENACLPVEVYRLYKRILVAILTGNTDMHFKNFAMFHTESGLRLTPSYDQVAAAIYKPYQYLALELDKSRDRIIGKLMPKNIIELGKEFKLRDDVIMMAIDELGARLEAAKDAAAASCDKFPLMRDSIIQFMERRWNGTFKLIGQQLSKKQ